MTGQRTIEEVQAARALRAVGHAGAVICAVHDVDHDEIAHIINPLTRDELIALTVVLAAAISPDARLTSALSWASPTAAADLVKHQQTARMLQPCGTHAAFNRHRAAGQEPCDDCWAAERIYQTARNRKRRAADAQQQEGEAA